MEGEGGDVFDERNGLGFFDQIGGDEVVPAGGAAFEAEVGELLSDVDGEFLEALLTAVGAQNALVGPFVGAVSADE